MSYINCIVIYRALYTIYLNKEIDTLDFTKNLTDQKIVADFRAVKDLIESEQEITANQRRAVGRVIVLANNRERDIRMKRTILKAPEVVAERLGPLRHFFSSNKVEEEYVFFFDEKGIYFF